MEEEEPPPLPLPQTLPDLEALIQRFYGLNTPQQYTQIDSALKSVQKAHGAFTLADQLMGSADANVRFFGALTFTVKVNRDWASLTAAEGKDLLDRLLFWFVRCVNGRDISLVVRKLCAALVAIFKQTAGEWTFCVRHAVACLVSDGVVGYNTISTSAEDQIRLLTESQATACLWLGSTLVEELSKLEVAGVESDSFLRAGSQNIPTLLDVIEHCLASDKISVLQDGIKLVHTIRLSSQPMSHDDDASKKRLSNLVLGIVSRIAADEMLTVIADLAMDIMVKDQGRSIAQLVATKIVEPQFDKYQKDLLDGDFNEESLLYGRLIVTTAGTWLDEQPDENSWKLPHLDEILERLILLAGAKGYPIEDDTLIPEVLDFWSVYAEWAIDLCSPGNEQEKTREIWCVQSKNNTSRVLEVLLGKLQMPSPDVFARWERQVQSEFRSLRRDFRDFSASAYALLGTRMLSTLVDYLLRLWAEQNWSGTEITLQCLKGVVETAVETEESDAAFLTFLTSPIFSMQDDDTTPLNVRQASIELLADCSSLFERQADPPMSILQWLFQCISQGKLSLPAAKAISSICDACRVKISSDAPGLASLWCNLAADDKQPPEVLERLAQAVGAVCQALWTQTKHKPERTSAIQALDSLLQTVLHQIQSTGMDNSPQYRDQRMTALQSLLNIAKSFHESEDEVVDLDNTGNNTKQSDTLTLQWIGSRQQDFITTLTRLLQNCPSDGDLMEAICLLLRAGMTDNLDSPFRFDQNILVCLVKEYLSTTPRPQFLLETVSRWLRRSRSWVKNGGDSSSSSSSRDNIAHTCLGESIQCLAAMYYAQDGPSNHEEHISSVLDFIAAYIPNDLELLTATRQTLHTFAATVQTAISCFTLPEPIFKQAASTFWIKLLDLRPGVSSTTFDATTQILSLTTPLLPHLTMILIHGLSGNAARSEIDLFVLPFRRLVVFPITRQPGAGMNGSGRDHGDTNNASNIPDTRTMISTALFDPAFPSTRVSEAQKRMFLEKVLRLRGESGSTGRVCREWWIACRGTFS